MPALLIAALVIAAAVAAFFLIRNEVRAGAARAAQDREREAKAAAFFEVLKRSGIPHTGTLELSYEIAGIGRTTPIVGADRDAHKLRFVAPYGCTAIHRSEPTGWGDWSWTELYFAPTRCPDCSGPEAAAYRFRSYRFDRGDGHGPERIASICLACHKARGEDGMDDDDVAFVQRCREAARLASLGTPVPSGPYRSAA